MKVKDLLRSLEGISGDLDVCVEDVDGKCINLTDVNTVKPVVYLGSVQEFPDDWYDDEGMEVGYDYRKEDEAASLELAFDLSAAEAKSEMEQRERKLKSMDAAERAWIDETIDKLAFLRERGFEVRPYFGGIVDGWPYNYIWVSRGMMSVAIQGSSVRNTDGTIDHVSGHIYNTEVLTLEALVKKIAKW